jgi:hypothetical protein
MKDTFSVLESRLLSIMFIPKVKLPGDRINYILSRLIVYVIYY